MAADNTQVSRRFDGDRDEWENYVDVQLFELQQWRTRHSNECHPAIVNIQNKMEGRWAIIAGFCFGVGLALGFIAAEVLKRWLGN